MEHVFNDLELKHIDQESAEIFKLRKDKLANISNDIKLLEERLKEGCISFEFYYFFDHEEIVAGTHVYQCICWRRNQFHNDFRLFYTSYKCSVDNLNRVNIEIKDKFLSDTKVSIRLFMHTVLPDFYRQLLRNLNDQRTIAPVVINCASYINLDENTIIRHLCNTIKSNIYE